MGSCTNVAWHVLLISPQVSQDCDWSKKDSLVGLCAHVCVCVCVCVRVRACACALRAFLGKTYTMVSQHDPPVQNPKN